MRHAARSASRAALWCRPTVRHPYKAVRGRPYPDISSSKPALRYGLSALTTASLHVIDRQTRNKFARIAYETDEVEEHNQFLQQRNY